MSAPIQNLFADVMAKLEDLHSISVEGQRPDNAPDMQGVLILHLRSGIAALDTSLRTIGKTLKGSRL